MRSLLRLGILTLLLLSWGCGTDSPVDPSAAAQSNFNGAVLEDAAHNESGVLTSNVEFALEDSVVVSKGVILGNRPCGSACGK